MEAPSLNVAPIRRRFQYDLKHLLLLFVALSAVLGWLHQRSRLARQQEQIQDLRQRIAVLGISAILRGEMTDKQKLAELAKYVKAGDAQAEVTTRLGTPDDGWTMGRGASTRDMPQYFPLARESHHPFTIYDGNIFLGFDETDKAIAVGYYGPVQGNVRFPVSLELR